MTNRYTFGVYEKALRTSVDWSARLGAARRAGFAFVEMSIDPDRLDRLAWSPAERRAFSATTRDEDVSVPSICLSAHREFPLGDGDADVRRHGRQILEEAIELSVDIGVRVIQIAGYYARPMTRGTDARALYVDSLAVGTAEAAREGVMLAIENVDGLDINSVARAIEVVDEIGSPWLQAYPDIGNIAENQLDMKAELSLAKGRMVAIHAKDVRVGEPRRVPFGEGIVPFAEAFATLATLDFHGRLMIEMWNDDAPDSAEIAARGAAYIQAFVEAAERRTTT